MAKYKNLQPFITRLPDSEEKIEDSIYHTYIHIGYFKGNHLVHLSSKPFVIVETDDTYRFQILRDIEFNFTLDYSILLEQPDIEIKIFAVKSTTHMPEIHRSLIISYVYDNLDKKKILQKGIIKGKNKLNPKVKEMFNFKLTNKDKAPLYVSNNFGIIREVFEKDLKIFSKNTIHIYFRDKLPPEIIEYICSFLKQYAYFKIESHKRINSHNNKFIVSNPHIVIPKCYFQRIK